jgi:O-antigen/teichoic acid export membrane protein
VDGTEGLTEATLVARTPGLAWAAARLRLWLLGQDRFARNVSIMLVGTVLGQGASVLMAPLLTRLYSPSEFGVLSVFMAFLNITVVLAALRFEIALSSARSQGEAINLAALCGIVLVCTTALLSVLAALAPESWLDALWLGSLEHERWLVPVGFACLGGYFIMLYYATWLHEFPVIARTRISQGLSGPISQIALGLLGLGAPGLAIGFVIGQSSGTLLMFRRLVLNRVTVLRRLSWLRIRSAMVRHRHYALVSSWAALIDALGTNQILYVLVSALYDGRIAGFLFLAERVVSRPLTMVSNSMLQVFMGEAGRAARSAPAQLRQRFHQIAARQFAIALVWVVVVDVGAQLWFGGLFGPTWRDAVPYVQALSIAFLGQAVVQSVQHTMQVLNRPVQAAVWQVGRMVAVTGGIVICWYAHVSALETILVYSVLQAAFSVALLTLMAVTIERIQVRA